MNPFAHLDPIGTLMLFTIGIGWAKPVILNPSYYPSKTKQMLIALAGPASNFSLALIFGFVLVFLQHTNTEIYGDIFKTLVTSLNIIIRINLILAIFNMIPIPPLDGSRVLAWMLPKQFEYYFLTLEPYGLLLILLILFFGGFRFLIIGVNFIQLRLLELIKNFISNYIL